MTLAEIAAAIGGDLRLETAAASRPETVVSGASHTDSREVGTGDIFFAKRGEETDGHLFAPAAVENGALLLVVERVLDLPVAQIVVADTVDALGALATEVIRRIRSL